MDILAQPESGTCRRIAAKETGGRINLTESTSSR